jgi:hypothetical protein
MEKPFDTLSIITGYDGIDFSKKLTSKKNRYILHPVF